MTPGVEFLEVKKGARQCGVCKKPVLIAQVRNPNTATLRWRNFEPTPVDSGAHRYYRRHFCPR